MGPSHPTGHRATCRRTDGACALHAGHRSSQTGPDTFTAYKSDTLRPPTGAERHTRSPKSLWSMRFSSPPRLSPDASRHRAKHRRQASIVPRGVGSPRRARGNQTPQDTGLPASARLEHLEEARRDALALCARHDSCSNPRPTPFATTRSRNVCARLVMCMPRTPPQHTQTTGVPQPTRGWPGPCEYASKVRRTARPSHQRCRSNQEEPCVYLQTRKALP